MKYFFDTEFIEYGKTIDLISIGIVCEDGKTFYAINEECDFSKASDWVLENVLAPMGIDRSGFSVNPFNQSVSSKYRKSFSISQSKKEIAKSVAQFLDCVGETTPVTLTGWQLWLAKIQTKSPIWLIKLMQSSFIFGVYIEQKTTYKLFGEKPEFWAYYADYDWVVFCQLFGTMMDLPDGFPMYCRDIKQLCDELGNPDLPTQGKGEHNALADALWNKSTYEFLRELKVEN